MIDNILFYFSSVQINFAVIYFIMKESVCHVLSRYGQLLLRLVTDMVKNGQLQLSSLQDRGENNFMN